MHASFDLVAAVLAGLIYITKASPIDTKIQARQSADQFTAGTFTFQLLEHTPSKSGSFKVTDSIGEGQTSICSYDWTRWKNVEAEYIRCKTGSWHGVAYNRTGLPDAIAIEHTVRYSTQDVVWRRSQKVEIGTISKEANGTVVPASEGPLKYPELDPHDYVEGQPFPQPSSTPSVSNQLQPANGTQQVDDARVQTSGGPTA